MFEREEQLVAHVETDGVEDVVDDRDLARHHLFVGQFVFLLIFKVVLPFEVWHDDQEHN